MSPCASSFMYHIFKLTIRVINWKYTSWHSFKVFFMEQIVKTDLIQETLEKNLIRNMMYAKDNICPSTESRSCGLWLEKLMLPAAPRPSCILIVLMLS